MDRTEIAAAFDDVFDHALVFHAYADYMRDYEMLFSVVADPRTGTPPVHLRYVFRDCVEADVRSTIRPDSWRVSRDDAMLAMETAADVGFVWGVRWQAMYPGARLLADSERAQRWEASVGVPFHEAVVETNVHRVTLVFSDLSVEPVAVGYTPFQVAAD